jgi:hypothetical protein
VALLMAGLPNAVYEILNNKVLTFFRRSNRIFLHNIDISIIDKLYTEVFKDYIAKPQKIISQAAAITNRYPYLVQLIGYYLWGITDKTITKTKLDYTVKQAKRELFQNVHALVYRDLSAKDQEFVRAMCIDEHISKIADIMERLDITKGYASRYRQRLLDSGLIQREKHGELTFTLPFMREFVLQSDD